jgi:uncharacterized membrane protein
LSTYTPIDVPGARVTQAIGINDDGQIVGIFLEAGSDFYHGFLKDGTTYTTIDVPGATSTQAIGINNRGQVVGVFSDGLRGHGFLKDGTTYRPKPNKPVTGGNKHR